MAAKRPTHDDDPAEIHAAPPAKKQKGALSNTHKDRLRKALLKSKGGIKAATKLPPPSVVSDKMPQTNETKRTTSASLPTKPSLAPSTTTTTILPPASAARTSSLPSSNQKLTDLQTKMRKKLAGSQFRWLNELLYTKPSTDSLAIFSSKPELFDIYHEGFRSQTESWPTNPVDVFLAYLARKPRGTVVADMGCGDAKIARTLNSSSKKSPQLDIRSFDLVKRCEEVTACDIANVPMRDAEADVVVFCLSLMGTNFMDFVREAYRVLKVGGELKIAEVVSRFPDVPAFVNALVDVGFRLVKQDASNKMFILFDFVKSSTTANTPSSASQKSSISKRPPPPSVTHTTKSKNSTSSKKSDTSAQRGGGGGAGGGKGKPGKKQNDGNGGGTSSKAAAATSSSAPLPLLKPCIYKRR
ncbi:25S rRNA (adenine645-N1)-methyltransferase [Geranomyces michiganensis]|nr:25S rRNA (adenine645-N1)-methyltransferase [Geranomyces michiganensis]